MVPDLGAPTNLPVKSLQQVGAKTDSPGPGLPGTPAESTLKGSFVGSLESVYGRSFSLTRLR